MDDASSKVSGEVLPEYRPLAGWVAAPPIGTAFRTTFSRAPIVSYYYFMENREVRVPLLGTNNPLIIVFYQ